MHLLDDTATGLATVVRSGPLLARTTPTTRGYVQFEWAELLMATGKEQVGWRVLDQAVSAYAEAKPGEQPWLYWVWPHDEAVRAEHAATSGPPPVDARCP